MANLVDIKFQMFFDRPKVQRAVKDGTKSVLAKFGAFVRRSAKTSIKPALKLPKSGKHTARTLAGQQGVPGGPPRGHTNRLRDLIFFEYDDRTETVVVGPTLFKSRSPTPPSLLEFGGTTRTAAGKTATYHKFPFMRPAMDKNLDKFPQLFRGAIKG